MQYRKSALMFISKIANENMKYINENGFAISGKNGPFGQKDTPLRNSAHWLIVYSFLWHETKMTDYKKMSLILYSYLKNKYFESRCGILQDFDDELEYKINGIIGQTYVSESFLYYGSVFNDQEALNVAIRIYLNCPYNVDKHRWEIVDLDGVNLGVDKIITHQLWHAAIGSELLNTVDIETIRVEVNDFVKNIDKIIDVNNEGVIIESYYKYSVKQIIKGFLFNFAHYKNPMRLDPILMERGYHLYHLYALTILKRNKFTDSKFNRIYDCSIQYVNSFSGFENKLGFYNKYFSRNIYAYEYNCPAFEYPFIFFDKDLDFANSQRLLDDQISYIHDKELEIEDYRFDKYTLLARIYELIRTMELLE